MRIFVTGGSGFIGTYLVSELLKASHHVTIFDKNESFKYPDLVVLGDVRDEEALTKATAGHDVIYHLAAEHADDVRPVSLYYDVNVEGMKNLIAAAEKAAINKIIFTSSVAVYPLNVGMPDEDSEIAPFNEYGKSKYAAEQVSYEWASKDSSRTLITVRPCVIFGENNRGNVYNLLSQIYSKRFIMIGNGQNKKSMGYVGNISKFMQLLLDTTAGTHIFNYADKPDLAISEIVEIALHAFGRNSNDRFYIPYNVGLAGGYLLDRIANITGKTFPVSAIRIKKFCADTTISAEKVLRTGFKAPYTLKEALERTIKAEFMNNGNHNNP